MKLDEMKVQYDRNRDGFSKESGFSVQEEQPAVKVNASGIAVKVGLCAAVLALAFVVRAFGIGKPNDTVAETSTRAETGTGSEQSERDSEQLGSLRYVEAGVTKWKAPVLSSDVELLRDGQLLRFTANSATVCASIGGTVRDVGTDEQLGTYVRIASEHDREAVYYGLETVGVKLGDTVATGQTIGSAAVGKSVFMKVLISGAPQDPTAFVDLSLGGK